MLRGEQKQRPAKLMSTGNDNTYPHHTEKV